MRKPALNLGLGLTLLLLLGAVTLGQGQEQKNPAPNDLGYYPPSTALVVKDKSRLTKKAPESLEETLFQILHQNPDIRVAEAKLHEAEAELQRVRLQVMQKAITVYHTLESERTAVRQAEEKLAWSTRMAGKGFESDQGVKAAAAALTQAKSKLAIVEADLLALLGKLPQKYLTDIEAVSSLALTRELAETVHPNPGTVALLNSYGNILALQSKQGQVKLLDATTGQALSNLAVLSSASPSAPARGAIADKIRLALDKPVTLRLRDKSLDDMLKAVQEVMPGIPFHVVFTDTVPQKINFTFEQIPLGAVLQALEDTFPSTPRGGLILVVRDYGILVTGRVDVPARALPLQDFWKGTDPTGKPKALNTRSSNSPPPNVEGVIKAVDAKTGLVTISIGSDAGLQKGQTLEVFRLVPQPVYLGKLEVIELNPTQAVGKPEARSKATIQVGDRVSGSMTSH